MQDDQSTIVQAVKPAMVNVSWVDSRLGVTPATIYRMARRDELPFPCLCLGSRMIRFDSQLVEKYIKKQMGHNR
jgi:excisionase family DNA binding protein